MTLRKVAAALLLVFLPLGFVAVGEVPSASADYTMTIFNYGPSWVQWTSSVGIVITCAAFTGPAAIACGLAGVA